MIVFRLAELKGKSFVEKGIQLQDIPTEPSFFETSQATPRLPHVFNDSSTVHETVQASHHAQFVN
jgi:hypothetical protein